MLIRELRDVLKQRGWACYVRRGLGKVWTVAAVGRQVGREQANVEVLCDSTEGSLRNGADMLVGMVKRIGPPPGGD